MLAKKKPRVSVIVPAWNREITVGRAINSILNQQFSRDEVEIIAVDDASDDSTPRILSEFSHRHPTIRIFRHESRRGAQAARNTGIQNSRAEWVTFLDSDDYYLPQSLASRLARGNESGADVIHSEAQTLVEKEGRVSLMNVPKIEGDALAQLLWSPGPVFPSLMVRRAKLEWVGGLDERLVAFQEWDTYIRLAACTRFAFVSEPTFVWVRHDGETISGSPARELKGYEQVIRKHKQLIIRTLGPIAMSVHYARLHSMTGGQPRFGQRTRFAILRSAYRQYHRILRSFRAIGLKAT